MSTDICEHGSIRRKCPHCENAASDTRIARLEKALQDIITHTPTADPANDRTEMRCIAARALDDPTYWYLYRETVMLSEIKRGRPRG